MTHYLDVDASGLERGAKGSFSFPASGGRSYVNIRSYQGGQFVCHFHPEIEVTLIVKGEMYYRVGDSEFLLRAGDAVFVNAEVMHAGRSVGESDCLYHPLNFWPLFVAGHEDSQIDQKYVSPLTKKESLSFLIMRHDDPNDAPLLSVVAQMSRLCTEKEEGFELLLKSAACRLWYMLYMRRSTAGEERDGVVADSAKRAIVFMEKHYSEPLSLQEIAVAAHLSRSELCRVFRRFTGRTVFSYLQYLRVRASLPLLQDQRYSVTDVAALVGFSGGSYYAEVFRRYIGYSPLEYRKKCDRSLTFLK